VAEHDFDEPYIVIERKSGDFGSFLLGAALGVGMALLLAPRSGAETRRELRRGVRRVREAAEGAAHDVAERVTDSFDYAKSQVEAGIDTARDAVEMRKAQVADAIDVGRAAARQAREDLERRIAETKASYQASETPRSGSATKS
jgi:gas vesicle protein